MERQHLIFISILIVLCALLGWIFFTPHVETSSQVSDITKTIPSRIEQPQSSVASTKTSSNQAKTAVARDSIPSSPYIVTCDSFDEDKNASKELEEMSSEYENYLNSTKQLTEPLKYNLDSDSQLVRAFLLDDSNGDKRIEILTNILNSDPDNKLANWDLLNICTAESSNKCAKELLANARDIHHQNAAVWLTAINTAYNNSDNSMAQVALEQLIAAPIFNDYYSDYLVIAERVFRTVENGELNEEQVAALPQLAVQSIPPIIGILEFCKSNTPENDHFSHLCLEAGKRMVFSSKTALSRMVGYAVQKSALTSMNNQTALAALEIKKEQAAYYNSLTWKKASSLLEHDSELYDQWFKNLVEFGENDAAEKLILDAVELSKDNSYRPCDLGNLVN